MFTPSLLLVGPPGVGKTVGSYRALNPAATGWILGEPGALDPCVDPILNPWRTGSKPAKPFWFKECLSVEKPYVQMQAAVLEATRMIYAKQMRAIAFDGFTNYLKRELTRIIEIEKTAENYGKAAKVLGRRARSLLSPIFEACATTGAPFVVIAHQNKGPQTIEGTFTPGAADVPNHLLYEIPSLFSTVVRVEVSSGKRIIRCDPLDTRYITRDRFNCVIDGEEMNLRAILMRIATKVQAAQ